MRSERSPLPTCRRRDWACSAVLLLLFGGQQPRLEQRHRLGAVLVLGALVLAFDDDAGRHVGDAHGGVGLVDVLAAGARGAVGVDAQVRRVDVDGFDFLELREDGNGAGGGVDPALRLGRRHALHAVRAGFKLETRRTRPGRRCGR